MTGARRVRPCLELLRVFSCASTKGAACGSLEGADFEGVPPGVMEAVTYGRIKVPVATKWDKQVYLLANNCV
jgi:hypothetical protein